MRVIEMLTCILFLYYATLSVVRINNVLLDVRAYVDSFKK